MMKKNYKEMTKPERQAEYAAVKAEFEGAKALHLELNMARGKPSRQQLDMVTPMLQVLTQPEQFVSDGVETRNYGEVAGIPAARKLFADILGCKPEQVFVGGNASLQLMYDAISKAFLAATNRVGLSLNYDSQQLTDYRIGCVGTAFRLYKQMGEPLYCETMRLIVAAWEGKPDSFRASVLKGMMHFVELYHGEFSEERLLRALRNIHPVDIYRIGQDDPAKLRGWKKYVFPIYTAYNGKCRKDALPMKF